MGNIIRFNKKWWQDFDDKEKEVLISVVNETIREKKRERFK